MSVAEMKIVGIVGPKSILNVVMRSVILQGNVHMIDAISRVNSADFFLPPTERNIEALEEEPFLKHFSERRSFGREEKIVNLFHDLFDIKPFLREDFLNEEYDYDNFMKQFLGIYKVIQKTVQEIEENQREIDKKEEFINNLKYLSELDLDINRLIDMKYLVFRLIRVTKENYDKLKKNYENIPAVVLRLATEGKYVTLLYIAPITLEETLERIFSSLNYTVLPVPREIKGNNIEEILEELAKGIEQDKKTIEASKKTIEEYKDQYKDELEKMFSRLEMEKKIEEFKSKVAIGRKLFFIFGFVPAGDVDKLKENLEKKFNDKLTIIIDPVKKPYSATPPTKLNNIKLFKPFESLVKMYGTPSYQEKDPTVFFALTYMFIFGAMFGDVGQGFVLLLGGLILEYIYNKIDFGAVLNRLGISSIIFGFIYGSVFGSEEIIPAMVIRPMSNIDNMLIIAVAFGIIFILFSYILSIVNAIRENNLKDGILGENGLTGFLFYVLLLYTVFRVFIMHKDILPAITITLLTLLSIMFFKEAIARRLFFSDKSLKKPSANEYIEGGFGLIEMLLSMLSNTISFLRVGAFALNHVGLFIAFLTLANMMSSAWGNWIVLFIGNVVILSLEGLIVFIQALRLEYYEMFTKYYRGDGIEYNPAKIKFMVPQKNKKILSFKTIVLPIIGKNEYHNYINSKTEV